MGNVFLFPAFSFGIQTVAAHLPTDQSSKTVFSPPLSLGERVWHEEVSWPNHERPVKVPASERYQSAHDSVWNARLLARRRPGDRNDPFFPTLPPGVLHHVPSRAHRETASVVRARATVCVQGTGCDTANIDDPQRRLVCVGRSGP
ncbi:hypothetical protein AAFF_G00230780 [Aldrovandia affinis]|uniref:Secreted protein n=1 Tax=Aldrovandia affinis TaxID=143900 RepID=A0AAD7RFK1_9TELE|nr:hypothetical protein AAFF_G00230780 [Aldrovandia affinis]